MRIDATVSECRNCNGDGETGHDCAAVHPQQDVFHPPEQCPDCVAGKVTNIGTIEWRCENWHIAIKTSDLAGANERTELTALRTPCSEQMTGVGHETCGLVLVVPIGDNDG